MKHSVSASLSFILKSWRGGLEDHEVWTNCLSLLVRTCTKVAVPTRKNQPLGMFSIKVRHVALRTQRTAQSIRDGLPNMAQMLSSQSVTFLGSTSLGRRSSPKRTTTMPGRRSGNQVARASLTSGGFSSRDEAMLMDTVRAGGLVVPRHEAGDPFGLLLRQRIVFLGNQVDDFTADAVISQLLLLDAQDPKKVRGAFFFSLLCQDRCLCVQQCFPLLFFHFSASSPRRMVASTHPTSFFCRTSSSSSTLREGQ